MKFNHLPGSYKACQDVRHTAVGWLELSFEIVAQIPPPGLLWGFSRKDLRGMASLCWKSSWCCPPGRGLCVPLSPSAPVPAGSASSPLTSSSSMTPTQPLWSWSPRPSQLVAAGGPATARTLLNTWWDVRGFLGKAVWGKKVCVVMKPQM